MAKKVSSRAKQLRLAMAAKRGREVTLKEVYETTGIAISTLSRLENNQVRGVDFATLAKLAEFYCVSNMADLLAVEEARQLPTQAGVSINHLRRRLEEAVTQVATGSLASI